MTFQAKETSVDDGRPVELLKVAYGAITWCYTTADVAITFDGLVYAPLPMSRAPLRPSAEIAKSSLTINVPQDCPFGNMYRVQPPSGIVSVTLLGEHYGDNDFKVLWKGRIINVNWQQPWMVLTVENVFSSLNRAGLRRRYSAQCPHVLYAQGDGLCNVNRATFKETYAVTALTGVTATFAGAIGRPSNFFAGGYIEWISTVDGSIERRMIRSSNTVTGDIVLASLPVGLGVGVSVDLYPGCDHKLATCNAKFANSLNFGGTPYIPVKNPFAAMIY